MNCFCGGTLWRFSLRYVNGKLVLHRYKCTQCATQFEQEVIEHVPHSGS